MEVMNCKKIIALYVALLCYVTATPIMVTLSWDPCRFDRVHYNLKGPVASLKIEGDSSLIYSCNFNKNGELSEEHHGILNTLTAQSYRNYFYVHEYDSNDKRINITRHHAWEEKPDWLKITLKNEHETFHYTYDDNAKSYLHNGKYCTSDLIELDETLNVGHFNHGPVYNQLTFRYEPQSYIAESLTGSSWWERFANIKDQLKTRKKWNGFVMKEFIDDQNYRLYNKKIKMTLHQNNDTLRIESHKASSFRLTYKTERIKEKNFSNEANPTNETQYSFQYKYQKVLERIEIFSDTAQTPKKIIYLKHDEWGNLIEAKSVYPQSPKLKASIRKYNIEYFPEKQLNK